MTDTILIGLIGAGGALIGALIGATLSPLINGWAQRNEMRYKFRFEQKEKLHRELIKLLDKDGFLLNRIYYGRQLKKEDKEEFKSNGIKLCRLLSYMRLFANKRLLIIMGEYLENREKISRRLKDIKKVKQFLEFNQNNIENICKNYNKELKIK